jgi:hypothetical protein
MAQRARAAIARRTRAAAYRLPAAALLLACCVVAAGASKATSPPPPSPPHLKGALHPNTTHTNLTKLELTALDATARCADGSPGVVYSAVFTDPAQAATWVVYLPAAHWCWSAPSCFTLGFWHPGALSSTAYPKSLALSGLFSPDPSKNPFAGANLAYVGYCSGDAFLGSANQTGYSFNGRAIVRAVFTHLVKMGLGAPYRWNNQMLTHRVLLAGGGAGGVGAMVALDATSDYLLSLGLSPDSFTLKGLLDASAWAPLPPVAPAATPPLTAAGAAMSWLNITAAQLSAGCVGVNPTRPEACLFAASRLPYVLTPYLLYAPLADKRQLSASINGRITLPLPAAAAAYAASLNSASAALLPGIAGSHNAAFAPACLKGPVGLHPTLWSVRVSPAREVKYESATTGAPASAASLRDALDAWFIGNATSFLLSDACTGFACGTGCRRHPPRRSARDAVAVAVAVAAAAPPRHNTFPGLRRWSFRLLLLAALGWVVYAFVQFVLAPMLDSLAPPSASPRAPPPAAGYGQPGPRAPPTARRPADEGTPLMARGAAAKR